MLEFAASQGTMMLTKAVAYLRTSSATNVGPDKDSAKRQLAAIQSYARQAGFEIVLPPFDDAAVSGADPIEARRGFGRMLAFLAEHSDVRTILVETASRFARDLIVQETGHRKLKELGIDLIAVDSPDSFMADGPTAEMVRQILGAVSQFEKAMVVLKLRAARDRKRQANGKCEGRKSHAERSPEVVTLARKLRRKPRNGTRMSYRDVAAALAAHGHVNSSGNPFGPSAIKSMTTD